jgi:ATP synthase protein I
VPEPGPLLRYGRSFALFWDFVGTVLAGAVVGWAIDHWFGTEPWAILAFIILGVVGGFVRLVASLRRLDRLDRDE